MCKLKSGIILKNRVFVPEYDSHTDMLKELGIEDDYLNASKTFVRVELSPADGDPFSEIDTWVMKVDQDIIPEWYNEEEYKPQVVDSVKEWAKTHVHIGVDGLEIDSGTNHYIKDCKDIIICDSATVKDIYGSATVEDICGNATVEYICDSATVKDIRGSAAVKNICGNATVEYICDSAAVKDIYGSATVEDICGNATVEYICGSATVKDIRGSAAVKNICDSATVIGSAAFIWKKKENLTIKDNATFKDSYTKTIYQAGDWKFVKTEGKINANG